MAQFNLLKDSHDAANVRSEYKNEKSSLQTNLIASYRCCVCGWPIFVSTRDRAMSVIDIYPINIPTASSDIPEKIRNIFLEALCDFGIKSWNSTATMCRRTVQELAMEKGATGDTLFAQIDDLASRQIITQDLKDWAHEIRILGKEGAHADVPTDVGEEEAKFAIDFTEDLLNFVYVLKARLQKRRQERQR
ncbi:MAG: DUF4145 domain-containing protein [Candidatus Omnitrophota bacterium]